MEFTVVVNSRRNAQGTNTDHSPPYNLWKTGAHAYLRSFHSITAFIESRDLSSWLFNECITNNAVAHAC